MPHKVIFLFVFALSVCFSISAQKEKYLTLKKYTQKEGLSSYNINKIVQDHLGYLWIGTQDGLNRFDGRDFLIFKDDPGSPYRVYGNNVSDMIEDTARNILWVGTSYGGITGIDISSGTVSDHISVDDTDKKLPARWVRALAVRDNILWIGTYQGLLCYDIPNHRYLPLDSSIVNLSGHNAGSIDRLFVDRDHNLWVGSANSGLAVFFKGVNQPGYLLSTTQLNLVSNGKQLYFWKIINFDFNKLMVATSLGVRSVICNINKHPTVEKAGTVLYNKEILCCALDENNVLWFSDVHGLYQFRIRENLLTKLKDDDFSLTNWQSSIYQIYPDGNHNIWFGGQEGLALYRNQTSPFFSYCKSSGSDTKIQHAFALLPLSDSIIICGAQDGTYQINTNNRLVNKIDAGGSVYLVYQHRDGNIILSNASGLTVLNNHFLKLPATKIYPELAILKNDLLNSAIQYNDSLVLFGSQLQKGIYVWNLKSKQVNNYNTANSRLDLSADYCNTFYKDNNKSLWILSQSHLLKYDPVSKSCQSFRIRNPLSGEDCQILFDMCQARNHYFFAAYGVGVIETDSLLHPLRVITTKDKLTNNGVYKVISYKDSLIFITSNNGLSTLNLATNAIRNYFQSDGLHSSAFEELCAVKVNEKIYAGGVNGFTVIDPQFLTFNSLPPRLYLNNIRSNKESGQVKLFNADLKTLEVPSDVLQTTLSFSGINYSNSERTTFAYKIMGLQNDWVDLGHQNFIDLVGNNPGRYKLEVRAANEDGVWCKPIGMALRFLPKWYQSWWFMVLLIMLCLLFIYWLYQLRIKRLKEMQAIRTALAIDLHDDLGSTLNSVKMYANLGLLEKNKDAYLQHIKKNTQEGIQSIRDIIWVMNENIGTIENLVNRVSMFGGPLCEATGINFKIQPDSNVFHYSLSQDEKQNIYLILKEGINNSVKYSGASKINLKVSLEKGKPVFTLSDNGSGFVTSDTVEGNGLHNMRTRAKRVKYMIAIQSQNGTTIQLQKM